MDIDERYKKGKIYKLICSETLDLYIGSTIMSLYDRLRKHRCKNNECESRYFVDPIIELIEDYPCNNRLELRKREQYFIDNNDCINKNKSYTTTTKEEEIEYRKKYYLENKERNKKYYLENKEKLNEKFNCDCGGKYTKTHEAKHKKTKKHKKYLDSII